LLLCFIELILEGSNVWVFMVGVGDVGTTFANGSASAGGGGVDGLKCGTVVPEEVGGSSDIGKGTGGAISEIEEVSYARVVRWCTERASEWMEKDGSTCTRLLRQLDVLQKGQSSYSSRE
jgi:hypothetical protein